MDIRTVDTQYISQIWHLVKDYIVDSIGKGLAHGTPDYTADQVLVYLTSGQWLLLVAVDDDNTIRGAMTISFINYPLNRVAFITTTGGKMIVNEETFSKLKLLAKHYGATKIQAMARPSMAKLLTKCGMSAGNTLMETTL